MRQGDRNKRNYIIIGLCAIVAIMAVGFAAFSQQLQINGTSEVTSSWCLGFDNTMDNTYVATPGIQTGTAPTGTMTYAGSTCGSKSQTGVTLASNLKQPGDTIEYTLTILNEGSLNAAIKSILVDNESVTSNQTITKGNIKYQIQIPLSTSISANSSTTMKVIVSFQNDTDITRVVSGENSSIEVKINAEQDDGNGGFTPTPATFTGTIYRNNTTSVQVGDPIVQVNETVYFVTDGETYASVGPYDSPSECQTALEGFDSSEGFYCQQEEFTSGGVGDYTTDASTLNKTYYLKHDVVDNIITASYLCFVTDTEHCLKGEVDESSSSSKPVYNANLEILRGYQSYYNIRDYYDSDSMYGCEFNDSYARCAGGGGFFYIDIHSNGSIIAYKNTSEYCSMRNNYDSSGSSCIG